MKTPLALGGMAAALIVGIAAGGAAAGSDDPTRTATTAPTPATVTTTVTEQTEAAAVTPQSCLDALTAAEAITRDSRHFVRAIIVYPSLILKSARAGMQLDADKINEVTATVKGISAKVDGITADVTEHVAAYNTAAEDCRATRT